MAPTPGDTCGNCRHSVPCMEHFKNKKYEPMIGWLVCLARQETVEDKARFISPYREACFRFAPKTTSLS